MHSGKILKNSLLKKTFSHYRNVAHRYVKSPTLYKLQKAYRRLHFISASERYESFLKEKARGPACLSTLRNKFFLNHWLTVLPVYHQIIPRFDHFIQHFAYMYVQYFHIHTHQL